MMLDFFWDMLEVAIKIWMGIIGFLVLIVAPLLGIVVGAIYLSNWILIHAL